MELTQPDDFGVWVGLGVLQGLREAGLPPGEVGAADWRFGEVGAGLGGQRQQQEEGGEQAAH